MRIITPILLFLCAISIFVWYVSPTYTQIKVKQIEANDIVKANQQAATLRAARQKLSDQRNKISVEQEAKLVKMIPDGVENVGLIIDIDNIAKKYGMNIRNAKVVESAGSRSPAVGPDSRKYGIMTLSFTVSTSYENFLRFLEDLESSLRLVDISEIGFNAGKDNKYDFNMALQTYWLK